MRYDPFAEQRVTVTVVRRTPTGRDDYGNATFTESTTTIGDCLVAWTGVAEDQADADRTSDRATVYDPSGSWPSTAVDRVELGGLRWEVDGTPMLWPGSVGGVVVELRRVSG